MKAFVNGARATALVGAALLVAACSSAGQSTSSSGQGSSAAQGIPAPAERAPAALAGGGHASAKLASVRLPGRQSVIYTASLTVRAKDVGFAAARASQLAVAAGGYVASEDTVGRSKRGGGRVSIQLKIPVAAYPDSLAALARLGKRLSQFQHAQDVTQTVADVTSRVASAKAAIAQLRRLLARAGSVGGLLAVQEQINQEESDLEALQSQQRALAGETTYGTISLLLVSTPVPAVGRHVKLGSGFTGGLAAGWQALRQVLSWLLTVAGAALPFAVPVALAAYAGYRARRRLGRRRAQPTQAE
jgi:hypothetical protein